MHMQLQHRKGLLQFNYIGRYELSVEYLPRKINYLAVSLMNTAATSVTSIFL